MSATLTQDELRARYSRYASKHPAPMAFKSWLWFREQASIGGKKGMRKRWGAKKP